MCNDHGDLFRILAISKEPNQKPFFKILNEKIPFYVREDGRG